MYRLSSYVASAVLAAIVVAPMAGGDRPWSATLLPSATAAGVRLSVGDAVNRSGKGDRLVRLPAPTAPRTVAAMEIGGQSSTAIVYRDPIGHVLFQRDPTKSVTIVAKNVVLPEVTVRPAPPAGAPERVEVPPPQAPPPPPQPLSGCEPATSTINASGLPASRCVTEAPATTRLAAVQ